MRGSAAGGDDRIDGGEPALPEGAPSAQSKKAKDVSDLAKGVEDIWVPRPGERLDDKIAQPIALFVIWQREKRASTASC